VDRRIIQSTRLAIKTLPLKLPSMIALFLWSIVPLGMTLWFSFQRYNLLNPGEKGFVGFENYRFLVTDPGLRVAILNTLLLVAWVLVITVGLGTVHALLFNQAFFGRGKSTLLRLIAGLEEVASGDILIDGEKVNDVPPAKRGLALIPHKINVNGISPGVVDTPMWDKVDTLFARYENRSIGEKKRLVGEAVPFGRMGRPKDHVGAAVFLASSDSDYIVAQTLNVDGGNWMS
jgi:hypothetical protein